MRPSESSITFSERISAVETDALDTWIASLGLQEPASTAEPERREQDLGERRVEIMKDMQASHWSSSSGPDDASPPSGLDETLIGDSCRPETEPKAPLSSNPLTPKAAAAHEALQRAINSPGPLPEQRHIVTASVRRKPVANVQRDDKRRDPNMERLAGQGTRRPSKEKQHEITNDSFGSEAIPREPGSRSY